MTVPAELHDAAVRFAARLIRDRQVTDWQEVQWQLLNHPRFGQYFSTAIEDDDDAMDIVRAAEKSLGDDMPSCYSD